MEEEFKKDETIRREFAKIFDWTKPKERYDYNDYEVYRTPTWAEIFVKVGRLLETKDNIGLKERLESLEAMFSSRQSNKMKTK